jgi:hypothetical protein
MRRLRTAIIVPCSSKMRKIYNIYKFQPIEYIVLVYKLSQTVPEKAYYENNAVLRVRNIYDFCLIIKNAPWLSSIPVVFIGKESQIYVGVLVSGFVIVGLQGQLENEIADFGNHVAAMGFEQQLVEEIDSLVWIGREEFELAVGQGTTDADVVFVGGYRIDGRG